MKEIISTTVILFFIFHCSLFTAFAQSIKGLTDSTKPKINIPSSPNITDEKGLKQGQWTVLMVKDWFYTLDTSKALYYRIINYKDGKPFGLVKDYYITGEKQGEEHLKSENPDFYEGYLVSYYKNGNKGEEGYWDNNIRVNLWHYWFEDGTPNLNYEGKFYVDNCDSQKADSVLFMAEKLYREKYGDTSLIYAQTRHYLGHYYQYINKFDEAESSYKKAYDILKFANKENHPDYYEILNCFSVFYTNINKLWEAEPLLKEFLETGRKLFKDDNPYLAKSINDMAGFYYNRGNYKEAEPLFKEALEMRRRLFKGDHPDLAQGINNMAMYYTHMDNNKEAEPLLKEALEMSRRL